MRNIALVVDTASVTRILQHPPGNRASRRRSPLSETPEWAAPFAQRPHSIPQRPCRSGLRIPPDRELVNPAINPARKGNGNLRVARRLPSAPSYWRRGPPPNATCGPYPCAAPSPNLDPCPPPGSTTPWHSKSGRAAFSGQTEQRARPAAAVDVGSLVRRIGPAYSLGTPALDPTYAPAPPRQVCAG